MKIYFIFWILFLSSTSLMAQNLSIGIEAGGISSAQSNYLHVEDNRRNTFYTGLNFNYALNKRFDLVTGLHYLQQGYQHTTCYVYPEGVENLLIGQLDYLTMPLSVNFYLDKDRRLFLHMGLYVAYNLRAKQNFPPPLGGCQIFYPEDIKTNIYPTHMGAIGGIGFRFVDNDLFHFDALLKYYRSNDRIHTSISGTNRSVLLTVSFNYKLFGDN